MKEELIFFSDWLCPDTAIHVWYMWHMNTWHTANNYALSEGSSSSPDPGWQQTMRNKSDNGAALVQTNLGVNSLECIFKTCVIGSIFTRLYCVESSSTWTLYVVVTSLQMVGVVLVGGTQWDLFISCRGAKSSSYDQNILYSTERMTPYYLPKLGRL